MSISGNGTARVGRESSVLQSFAEIVILSIVSSPILGFVWQSINHFIVQPKAQFMLLSPSVLGGSLVIGAFMGMFYGLLIFFTRTKDAIFTAIICGLVAMAPNLLAMLIERNRSVPFGLAHYTVGFILAFLQGCSCALLVRYLISKFGSLRGEDNFE